MYNKEYARGTITGAAFWISLFTVQYLIYYWEKINTDTFYVQDYFNEQIIHPVIALKPDEEQVGLPTGKKVLLAAAALTGASAYIFGIIDSYKGAKRYNRKLVAHADSNPEFYCALSPRRNEAGLRLRF